MLFRTWLKAALALVRSGQQRTEEPAPRCAEHHSVPAHRRLRFLDLPEDILEMVVAHFRNPAFPALLSGVSGTRIDPPRTVYKGLIPISVTCRSMRNLCVPLLFHTVRLRAGRRVPQTILHAVQVLDITLVDVASDQTQIEEMLRRMSRLSYVYLAGANRLGRLEGLSCLASAPALRVLTLNCFWLTAETGPIPTTLRELHLYHPDARAVDILLPPDYIPAHLSCLERLFSALHAQLECLTLYGEALRLSIVAACHWSSLREFAVIGRTPIVDVPWTQVLQCMPHVLSFTLLTDAINTPASILGRPPELTASVALARLRRLSLSFPSADDGIFNYLSTNLAELALRDSPRYYHVRWDYANRGPEPILSCHGIIRIFDAFSARGLRALELVYLEDELEGDMLASIAQSCPQLAVLELHRYRDPPFSYFDWYETGTCSVPVESLARALAAFGALRTAKLNLSVSKADIDEIPPMEFWDALDAFLDAQVRIVARHVPWLDRVAYLARTRGEYMSWAVWDVLPGARPRLIDPTPDSEREWDWL